MEDLNINIVKIVPENFIFNNNILPYNVDEENLFVYNLEEITFKNKAYLEFLYKKKCIEKLIEKDEFDELIKKCFGNLDKKSLVDESLSDLIETIINEAIEENVSDIHIEPTENQSFIRFRKDGMLYEHLILEREVYESAALIIKIYASLDIADKRIFQDGKMTHSRNGKNYDIRISIVPTIFGEKIVLRIIYKHMGIKDTRQLGFFKEHDYILKKLMEDKGGMVLVTGPTGSGKTSTLYSLLDRLNSREINITTLEDPVEVTINGICQININSKKNVEFSTGLRSVLRQDPDVIMVGEIRDEDTAKIAIRASITGHKVLSTLHTNSAIGAINRLKDMGVKEYFIRDGVKGIIGQRLIRKLCPYCKLEYTYDNPNLGRIDGYKPNGCNMCRNTGFIGRVLIYNILINDGSEFIEMSNFKAMSLQYLKEGIIYFEDIKYFLEEEKIG